MKEHNPYIYTLFQKYLEGNHTEKELDILLDYFKLDEESEQFKSLIEEQFYSSTLPEVDQEQVDGIVQETHKNIKQIIQPVKSRKMYIWSSVAAVAVILLTIGIFLQPSNKTIPTQELTSNYGGDALPASNRATLTLSSGQTVELREDKTEVITNGYEISYSDGNNITNAEEVQYATLTTPRGGQYNITLSDGTKVNLNAGSSLTYPIVFTGNERQVELHGEGYFEVTPNAELPFIVKTALQQVQVLGTVFNIQAYSAKETTTLVSGKVLVIAHNNEDTLIPNSQAIINNGELTIRKVDVSDYIGWKEGRFQAELITLRDLTEDIERWYDVSFNFPNNYRNTEKAFISINRNEKLSKVLDVLELTYGVQFRIDGKEVHVK